MNVTTPDSVTLDTYSSYIAHAMMASYMIGLLWFIAAYGNRPGARPWTAIGHVVAPLPKASDWVYMGHINFRPKDVSPPVLRESPIYVRTYSSGKQAWRYWDDTTEEWVYCGGPHTIYS